MHSNYRSAIAIAADIRSGDCSAREVTQAFIARIEATAQALNAVVVRRFDEAVREADAIDAARAAGRPLGPLAGVPITIKESFDVAGLATTVGHPERAGHRAQEHSVAVARLVAAGAIVLGKSNVPKDLADWQSFNAVYGVTRNPWHAGHSPGGSSGGAAAALAAGLSALELGSDIAGSIRVPATYCGVWGHKPTYGIVPLRGHGNETDAAPTDILVGGPMARTAADLELALDLLSGPDPLDADAGAWHLALPQEPRDRLAGFRFAVVASDTHFPVDGSIRDALGALADSLVREGATVEPAPMLPIGSEDSFELFVTLLRAATSGRLTVEQAERIGNSARQIPAADRSYDAVMQRGLGQSHRRWLEAKEAQHRLGRRWQQFFERYDALICPVTTTPAFPNMIGLPKTAQFFEVDGTRRPASDCYYWIGIPSLAGLPATAIPLGVGKAGLPVGAQVVGPRFADRRCLTIARLIEQAFYSFRAPPAIAM